METKVVAFRLPETTVDDLDAVAVIFGTNRSDAVRRAIAWKASEIRAALAVPDWSPRNVPSTVEDWS